MSWYEPVTLLSEGFRLARKEHKCRECHRVIKPGEKYLYETYVFEGNLALTKPVSTAK